jgi:NAD(P)-dependent dehydrogenase (short-subunit alcohol dehydrogenase family)
VLAVTLKSQFLMGQQVGQQMATQDSGGRIVNVGSTSGFTGRSRAVAYSAAKGGVANLTRAMATQLAPHKIRVKAIVPNKIGSPVGKVEFNPARRVANMAERAGLPAEAAKACCSWRARIRPSSTAPISSSTAAFSAMDLSSS